MIENEEVREIQSFGAQESQKFTIKVGGKAFSMLINGLYSNKIESIMREICTNAWDSHKIAGYPDRKFTVHLPSLLDPSFFVRDFGVSLAHEQVMQMYTTLFESTKDKDNIAVGKFGLGAKTPFAYSDQFTVQCWMDGETRLYNAYIGVDGVPAIDLIHREASDEERGVQVGFPVNHDDFKAFRRAAAKVLFAFDVRPDLPEDVVDEIDAIEQSIMFQTDTIRLFDNCRLTVLPGKMYARQGCVLYPIDINIEGITQDVRNLLGIFDGGIIEFDIGDVQMTPDRENLSYDPVTIANINKKCEGVMDQLRAMAHRWAVGDTVAERMANTAMLSNTRQSIMRTLEASMLPSGRRKMFGQPVTVMDGTDSIRRVVSKAVSQALRVQKGNVRASSVVITRLKKDTKTRAGRNITDEYDELAECDDERDIQGRFDNEYSVRATSTSLVSALSNNISNNVKAQTEKLLNDRRRAEYIANKVPEHRWYNIGRHHSSRKIPVIVLSKEVKSKSYRQQTYAVASMLVRMGIKTEQRGVAFVSGLTDIHAFTSIIKSVNFANDEMIIIDATKEIEDYNLKISGDMTRLAVLVNGSKATIMTQGEVMRAKTPVLFVDSKNDATVFGNTRSRSEFEWISRFRSGKFLVVFASKRRMEIMYPEGCENTVENFVIEKIREFGSTMMMYGGVAHESNDAIWADRMHSAYRGLASEAKALISKKVSSHINMLANATDAVSKNSRNVKILTEMVGGDGSQILRDEFGKEWRSRTRYDLSEAALVALSDREPYSLIIGKRKEAMTNCKTLAGLEQIMQPNASFYYSRAETSLLSSLRLALLFETTFKGENTPLIRSRIRKAVAERKSAYFAEMRRDVSGEIRRDKALTKEVKASIASTERAIEKAKREGEKERRRLEREEARQKKIKAAADRIASRDKAKLKKAEVKKAPQTVEESA